MAGFLVFNLFLLINSMYQALCEAKYECPGQNEVYGGEICQKTCDGYPTSCGSRLIEGCICRESFVREFEGGKCIPFEWCPNRNPVPNEDAVDTRINHRLPETSAERYENVCKETEQYVYGSAACEETCDRRGPFPCHKMYISGCVCKPGFIRQNLNGPCISIDQCPSRGCDADTEEYSTNIACKPTCDYPEGLDKDFCSTMPVYRGCACKKGFIRENLFGKCIPADKCPVVPEDVQCHKEHEKYRLYGNNCEPTCKNKLGTMYCTPLPQGACHCPYELGYVRADNGSCILATECPEEPCLYPVPDYVYPTDGKK